MISMKQNYSLPAKLYRAEQVRELDRCAIQDFHIPGIRLMRRAGQATFDYLRRQWSGVKAISVWCGSGNNGGDGYIVAGLACRQGIQVQLIQVGEESKLRGDARLACDWARQEGVVFSVFDSFCVPEGEVIIDALLGTGLMGEVSGRYAQAVSIIDESEIPVLAVDIPSGLCSDTGAVLGQAVMADATMTFIGAKQGLLTGAGPAHCGNLVFDDLAVPAEVFDRVEYETDRIDAELLAGWLPARPRDAHKGDFGRVLVVGGNLGTGGAALMAAQAAGRAGAGLVHLATRPEHLAAVLARCPEVMAHGVNSGQDLEPMLADTDVVVIGPGLGQNAWSEQLLRVVLASDRPLVVDADALNLISTGVANHSHRNNWLLTPHPGEAARLMASTTVRIQSNRFDSIKRLQQQYGGTVVLKGAGSLICDGEKSTIALCSAGNPGMASGGMGDVLSGVLGGLLAQGFSLSKAARLGVSLHAAAADKAAQAGERGMLATDLLPHLRKLVNPSRQLC
ncbi:MAG: NAD(P)H-hydrate dehydratase [Pseudomonadales bacterium]|nr:NAD(P)H-hydrate dehydratase [Pseudomonadales bacterium]